jgi:hypothetical protein
MLIWLTLFTVTVYVVPSTRLSVGPGEVIELELVKLKPYALVDTSPAYIVKFVFVCAFTVTAIAKGDIKVMTIINANANDRF